VSLLGLALMLGVAEEALPSRTAAAAALLYEMSCRDEDGYTLCDPVIPVEIEFTRFDCVSEPVRHESELARATCRIAGRVRYLRGALTGDSWRPLPGKHADFWLPRPDGPRDITRWQAFGPPHLGRVPG
jgi:hypothetical protein